METEETFLLVKKALKTLRVPPEGSEYDLHAMIAKALTDSAIEFRHEVPICRGSRIDFLVGNIGIEVKQGKHSKKALKEQAARYLASEEIEALLLVTRDGAMLPGLIGGKRVEVFGLSRLWGIALP